MLIRQALPNTLKLTVPSFILSMILAFILGVLAATYRDSWWDNLVKFLAVLGQALPGFWVAIMAVLIFSVNLRWLPVAGMAALEKLCIAGRHHDLLHDAGYDASGAFYHVGCS